MIGSEPFGGIGRGTGTRGVEPRTVRDHKPTWGKSREKEFGNVFRTTHCCRPWHLAA